MIFIIAEDTDKEGTGLLSVMDEELGKSCCYSEKDQGGVSTISFGFWSLLSFKVIIRPCKMPDTG